MPRKGYRWTESTRRKNVASHTGKRLSEETKHKISLAKRGVPMPLGFGEKITARQVGSKLKDKTKRKIRDANLGENNPNWKGGASFKPYCEKFTESLRENVRDAFGRKCFLCNEPENGRRLSVHHCDYNRGQGCGKSWNLIPLCVGCHGKTSKRKHYYFNLLSNHWAMNPEINFF
ncbi:MAG: NUMOD3 domain-containing DNA-binding protein [Dehalococcoidia bacterium]|jgi:5-methylcytosine-specific restriction endonuclease McrA